MQENETESTTDDAKKENNDNNDNKSNRFEKGQKLTFVRVRFPGNAKSFPFLLGKKHFLYGQKVLAMSDRGMAVGYINSFPYESAYKESMQPLRTISRIATDQDINEQKNNVDAEKKAEDTCKRLIEKHKLKMNVTHVELIHFGKKAVFYFTAPNRIDFRELVKDLVGEMKMRIELRQISVRDRSAALGSYGVCGMLTCCSSFLNVYGNTGIKMAKNQSLTLLPSKINGACDQLKCCLRFEDEVYSEKRKKLPKQNSFIKTSNGDIGKVIKLHIFIEEFEMLTDQGRIRRYSETQFSKNSVPPKDWKFPERFDHITNETSELIGEPKKVILTTTDELEIEKNKVAPKAAPKVAPKVVPRNEEDEDNIGNRMDYADPNRHIDNVDDLINDKPTDQKTNNGRNNNKNRNNRNANNNSNTNNTNNRKRNNRKRFNKNRPNKNTNSNANKTTNSNQKKD